MAFKVVVATCFAVLFREAASTQTVRGVVVKQDYQTYQFARNAFRVVKVIESEAEGYWFPYAPSRRIAARACGTEGTCAARVVGENHQMKYDVAVSSCRTRNNECTSELRALRPRPLEDTLTLCIPPVRGDYLLPSMKPYLENYLQYYWRQGVKHSYIYGYREDAPEWLSSLDSDVEITWIKLTFGSVQNMWYFGQNWVLQDCVSRATSEGFLYMLSIDLDEILTFADPTMTIATYATEMTRHGFDVANFGSSTETLDRACGTGPSECDKEPPAYQDISCFVPYSRQCKPITEKSDWRYCPGFCGHRKHLVYGPRVMQVNIHYATQCLNGTCTIHTETTDVAWLRHFQGQSLTSGRCPDCLSRGRQARGNFQQPQWKPDLPWHANSTINPTRLPPPPPQSTTISQPERIAAKRHQPRQATANAGCNTDANSKEAALTVLTTMATVISMSPSKSHHPHVSEALRALAETCLEPHVVDVVVLIDKIPGLDGTPDTEVSNTLATRQLQMDVRNTLPNPRDANHVDKVRAHVFGEQPTYADLIRYAATSLQDRIVILMNADVVLRNLDLIDPASFGSKKLVAVLTLRSPTGDFQCDHHVTDLCTEFEWPGHSFDGFVFNTSTLSKSPNFDFLEKYTPIPIYMNDNGAENRAKFFFEHNGYAVVNPCFNHIAEHWHCQLKSHRQSKRVDLDDKILAKLFSHDAPVSMNTEGIRCPSL